MPLQFFHFAPIRLRAGSIIEPGNFGRIISTTQTAIQGQQGSLIAGYVGREALFEAVRLREFPDRPSRFEAAFGCPTIDDAQAYGREMNADGRQVLHEVEVIAADAVAHTAFISFCDITYGAPFIETTMNRARQYWAGAQGDLARGRELVVTSPLKVIRVL